MKMGFRRQFIAFAGAIVLFLPVPGGNALADSPVETAIRDLVAAIDGSPSWTASYRSLSYDAAADTALLSGLAIATKKGDLKIDFESISVAGYAPAADGGFAAKSIKADGGAIDTGPIKLAIGDVGFDDVGVPSMAGGAYDPDKPFTSIMRMYSGILKAKLGHGRIGSLALIEIIEGVTNRISYENFEISDYRDGKTASITAGPIKLKTPSPDGLVDMTVAGIEATDIDLGAMIRVYDPAAYGSDGTGDLVWHQTLGHAAYKDVEMTLPGAKVAIGGFSMDAFRVRQPRHSFASFLDAVMAHPTMSQQEIADVARDGAVDLFSAFSIGRFGMSDLKVQATGITQLELGDFNISDLSIDGLGEFAIDGLVGAVEGQGSVKVGRFAFGGMKFPDTELLRAAIKASAGGGANSDVPFDPTSLIPTLGFMEAAGIDIQTSDVPHMALDKLRIDLTDYVGYLPTRVGASLSGLDLPLDSLDRQARETFKRLGYDRVSLDYRLKYGWDEAKEQLDVEDFHIRAADIGGITGSAVIGGLTRTMVEHPDNPEGAQNLALVSGKLTFNDESIVGKGLGLIAEKMKVPPDKFRQQFADALPFLLSISALNDPTLMTILRQSGLLQKLTPAVKTFVAEPSGSLTLTMAPTQPVGLATVAEAAQKAPETLIGLLNLSISAEAGAAPPANKSPNDSSGTGLRPTIAPAQ